MKMVKMLNKSENPQKTKFIDWFSATKVVWAVLCLMIFTAFLPMISAFEFDNVKVTGDDGTAGYPNIEIKNAFGFGDTLWSGELKSNTDICGIECSAEKNITLYESGSLVDEVKFETVIGEGRVEQPIIDYQLYIKTGEDEYSVDDYEWQCAGDEGVDENGTEIEICSYVLIGSHTETNPVWEEYELGSAVEAGNYRIKLEGRKGSMKTVDWMIKSQGVWIDDWAYWSGSGLVLYYKLDETTGAVIDEMENNNGTNVAMTRGLEGRWGNAFGTTAAAKYINISTDGSTTYNFTSLTVSLWVNITGIKFAHLIDRRALGGGDATSPFYMNYDQVNNRTRFHITTNTDGENTITSAVNSVNRSEWNHLAGTYDATTGNQSFYINGVIVGSSIEAGGLINALQPTINLAAGNGGSNNINGSIDEVRLYNRSLSIAEIQSLYAGGVRLNSPDDGGSSYLSVIDFNCTAGSYGDTIANISLWTNQSGTLQEENATVGLTGAEENVAWSHNTDSIAGDYMWSCEACDSLGVCEFSEENRTYNIVRMIENSQTYNTTTFEGSSESFIINVTYDSSNYGIAGLLVYNNTAYSAARTGTGDEAIFSKTLGIQDVSSETNQSFYWSITTTNGDTTVTNTTANNQTVKELAVDDCSSYGNEIFNFTLRDEETKEEMDGDVQNSSVEITLNFTSPLDPSISITFSTNFSENTNPKICMENLSFGSRIDATISYTAEDYVTEYYYLENYILANVTSKLPNNIGLYDLLTDDATSYLLTYQDCNYLVGQDKIIQTWRRYVEDGNFLLVEMTRTDENGQGVTHLVSEDIEYQFIVLGEGIVEWETETFRALCISTPCEISISQICDIDDFIDYTSEDDFVYTLTSTQSTRTVELVYTVPSGASATVGLNMTQLDYLMNNTICAETQTGAGGSLNCIVPTTLNNRTYYVEVFKDGEFIVDSYFSLDTNPVDEFGVWGVVLSGFLILAFGLMFIATGWGVVIGAVLGLIVSSVLSLVAFSWTIMIWLAVAGAIIVWKVSKKSGMG